MFNSEQNSNLNVKYTKVASGNSNMSYTSAKKGLMIIAVGGFIYDSSMNFKHYQTCKLNSNVISPDYTIPTLYTSSSSYSRAYLDVYAFAVNKDDTVSIEGLNNGAHVTLSAYLI